MAPMAMSFLEKLRSGRTLTGMQCFSASPTLVECMGGAGLDFTVIDLEHCPTGLETVCQLVRAADCSQIASLVRVPDLDAALIGRTLDLGVLGIVLPHSDSGRCRRALRAMRYAPDGDRGACPVVRAAGYLPPSWADFAQQANRQVMLIPLIEDAAGVSEVAEILELDGVEVVFLGPFDLSVSMGLPGADFRHPKLATVLDAVLAAAARQGKYVMTTVGATLDEDYAAHLVARGVRLLSFSADIAVFLNACRRIAAINQERR